jgi:hypothetical protein
MNKKAVIKVHANPMLCQIVEEIAFRHGHYYSDYPQCKARCGKHPKGEPIELLIFGYTGDAREVASEAISCYVSDPRVITNYPDESRATAFGFPVLDAATQMDKVIEFFEKPAEPKLRAWKPEEVPLGCWFICEKTDMRFAAAVVSDIGVLMGSQYNGNQSWHKFEYLLASFKHSIDGGKTWHPCGVLEVA